MSAEVTDGSLAATDAETVESKVMKLMKFRSAVSTTTVIKKQVSNRSLSAAVSQLEVMQQRTKKARSGAAAERKKVL